MCLYLQCVCIYNVSVFIMCLYLDVSVFTMCLYLVCVCIYNVSVFRCVCIYNVSVFVMCLYLRSERRCITLCGQPCKYNIEELGQYTRSNGDLTTNHGLQKSCRLIILDKMTVSVVSWTLLGLYLRTPAL